MGGEPRLAEPLSLSGERLAPPLAWPQHGTESSCYKCLRSYNNRFLHHDLDRELGASLLKHLLGDIERPRLSKEAEQRLLTTLATDLRDMDHVVEQHDGFLSVTSLGDRRIVLSHALLAKHPGTSEAEAAYAAGRNNSAPIDHLRVKRALPSAIEMCVSSVGARPPADAALPAGLVRAEHGIPLHTFSTLADDPTTIQAVADISIAGYDSTDVVLLEIDGPQLERASFTVDGQNILLAAGTVLVFQRLSEVADKGMHDGRLRLVRSSTNAFKATKKKVTLAMCKWTEFEGQISVRLQYQSTNARATPQKAAPETLTVIGKPIGLVRSGVFHAVKLP